MTICSKNEENIHKVINFIFLINLGYQILNLN